MDLILKTLCGSRAYGLHDENSDYDYHGVFVVPTEKLLGLDNKIQETSIIEGEEDNTAWEVGHFLRLALHCNPTVLETFVAPLVGATQEGDELRALFPKVLSRKPVFSAFRGYAANQRAKMFDPDKSGVAAAMDGKGKSRRQAKAAVAYLRSLAHGIELLRDGTYNPTLKPGHLRTFLVNLRSAREPAQLFPEVIRWANRLEDKIQQANDLSVLPEEPDRDAVEAFLLTLRRQRL